MSAAGDVDGVRIPGDDARRPDATAAARRCTRCGTATSPRWAGRCAPPSTPVDDFGAGARDVAGPANGAVYPDSDLGRALRRGRAHRARRRRRRGDHVDQGDWDMHTGHRDRRVGPAAPQRRWASPRRCRGVLRGPRTARRQGDPGGPERVRPPGRRRTRTRASTTATATSCSWPVPGSTGGVLRHLARTRRRAATPTCWSPPTTAACWPRSWQRGSAPAPAAVFPGFPPGSGRRHGRRLVRRIRAVMSAFAHLPPAVTRPVG